MFKKVKNGSTLKLNSYDEGGYMYDIQLPPVGYGVNVATGELEKTDIIKRSDIPTECYWERAGLPEWYEDKREDEELKQQSDPEYFDEECEAYREQEWTRRLCGVWFENYNPFTEKVELQYVYGLHYFYMNWWKIDIGYPKWRIVDRDSFYILGYCLEDPDCLGLVECTKRKNGKTYRAGAFLYEYISRTADSHGGIQSKNDDDAWEMYIKAVMNPWTELPHFFRPIFDTSKGDRPEDGLYFKETSRRGKLAGKKRDKKKRALNSFIDYKNALDKAYDGPRLQRYVSDESGKLDKKFDIEERQRVVRYTTDIDFDFLGKHLYTTTVEDMESAGSKFEAVWKNSNPAKRDGNNRTITGLYRYFIPGYRTGKVDLYGYTDEDRNKKMLENQLKAIENDPIAWASHVRKNPPTIRHAFWRDANQCMYNATKLNRRREDLSMLEFQPFERGNFRWDKGLKDSKVIWEKNENGRWEICWTFPPNSDQCNNTVLRGNLFHPGNTSSFIAGIDPYQQDSTQNEKRRSDAASYVLKRHNPFDNSIYNKCFVSRYHYRPATTSMLYEDMIMQCFYFGCKLIFETNKAGSLKTYFTRRGYQNFLIYIPGYKEPGIPSTADNKQVMSELTEAYIEEHIDNVFFPDLIDSWLKFDIKETEREDDTMAAGWTLVADMQKSLRPETGKVKDISEIIKKYKVKVS
jgi:hypothetical protein